MSDSWPATPVGPRITELGKSTLPAGFADDQGAFPFYCSSPQVRRIDRAITTTSAILMGTGGVATVHLGQGAFSYSTDTWAFTVSDPWTDLAFLYRQLEHRLPQIDYAGFGGSGLRHLDKEYIRRLSLPVPSLEEQALIARMLCAIDTAIHETEAIIAKLKAVKQGLLHDLLTRGIDASGELRPSKTEAPHLYRESPLEWIPKEWAFGALQTWLAGKPRNGYSPQEAGEWTGTQ
ncbi:MAG: restriction endonuclease subunit S, partial [Proteobacteria bacterium]|nr:restriction endonuclease subunit S [Pseudomonadota bacterium]